MGRNTQYSLLQLLGVKGAKPVKVANDNSDCDEPRPQYGPITDDQLPACYALLQEIVLSAVREACGMISPDGRHPAKALHDAQEAWDWLHARFGSLRRDRDMLLDLIGIDPAGFDLQLERVAIPRPVMDRKTKLPTRFRDIAAVTVKARYVIQPHKEGEAMADLTPYAIGCGSNDNNWSSADYRPTYSRPAMPVILKPANDQLEEFNGAGTI